MAYYELREIMQAAPAERPVVFEGAWLNERNHQALAAFRPAHVLEGKAEAVGELPAWLVWHAHRYPGGAAFGFLAYELARAFESLPLACLESLPEFSFAYYPRVQKVRGTLPPAPEEAGAGIDIRTNFDPQTYSRAVQRIREYLAAGDIYQANLTQQFSVKLACPSPAGLYRRLAAGAAPFRAFLRTPSTSIVSNSPERFFSVSGRKILASPIKGTIARSACDAQAGVRKLLASAKDRAENTMIVDLVRNDLGRICRYGSIQACLFQVVPLPHLFHLVSHVQGTLRPEVGLPDILRALFPCGSVTGAPKIRAMEILSEVEQVPRGVSMGAIGIIRPHPAPDRWEMDFSVAIRTVVIRDGVAVFNVGGGIVYDSSPQGEYDEMTLKARPLLEALGMETERSHETPVEQSVA